jgi:hypothetical protein
MSAISMETRNSGGVINRFRGTGDSRAPGLTSFYTGFDVVRDIFPFLFIHFDDVFLKENQRDKRVFKLHIDKFSK